MKKILFLILLSFTPLFSQTGQLKNFNEVLDALKSGSNVNAVIEYSRCNLIIDGQPSKSPDAIGGMDVKPFEYFAAGSLGKNKGFISTSETALVYLPQGGYVYNYVKLRIYEDNSVEVKVSYLSTDKLEVKMDETFTGTINDSSNDGGVSFYLK